MSKENVINHPDHYSFKSMECSVIIEAMTENLKGYSSYCVGNVVKYLYRFPLKNGLEDLRKARKYLEFLEEADIESSSTETASTVSNTNNKDSLSLIVSVMTDKLCGYTSYLVGKITESLYNIPVDGKIRVEEALANIDSLIEYVESLGSTDGSDPDLSSVIIPEKTSKEVKKPFLAEFVEILLVALVITGIVEACVYFAKYYWGSF